MSGLWGRRKPLNQPPQHGRINTPGKTISDRTPEQQSMDFHVARAVRNSQFERPGRRKPGA